MENKIKYNNQNNLMLIDLNTLSVTKALMQFTNKEDYEVNKLIINAINNQNKDKKERLLKNIDEQFKDDKENPQAQLLKLNVIKKYTKWNDKVFEVKPEGIEYLAKQVEGAKYYVASKPMLPTQEQLQAFNNRGDKVMICYQDGKSNFKWTYLENGVLIDDEKNIMEKQTKSGINNKSEQLYQYEWNALIWGIIYLPKKQEEVK